MESLDNDDSPPTRPLRWRRKLVLGAILIAIAALTWSPLDHHLEAAALLVRFEGAEGTLAEWGTSEVTEGIVTETVSVGEIRLLAYAPTDIADPPVVIMVHGVHHAGIDEPRLRAFVRSFAQSGARVLVPELRGLTEYVIDRATIDTIGEVAKTAARRYDTRVSVIGVSFGGGLALIAAADPTYRDSIGVVLSIGGHNDMARLVRWYAGEEIASPDGAAAPATPEPYGLAVLAFQHVAELFDPRDSRVAGQTLRLLLQDQRDEAQRVAQRLSHAGQERMAGILEGAPDDETKIRLLALIEEQADALAAISPHHRVGDVSCDVYLLHGDDDPIVSSVEAWWNASEIPADRLAGIVVTPYLRHAEGAAEPTLSERLALVGFVAAVLESVRGE